MKVYKFTGNYKKLEMLGYERMKFLEFDGFRMYSKLKKNCSVVVFNYVSVKVWENGVGSTYATPELIKLYIQDLIDSNLVEIGDI